jgi:hypothetical protein
VKISHTYEKKELKKTTDPNHQQLINRKKLGKKKIRYENVDSVSNGWKLEGG